MPSARPIPHRPIDDQPGRILNYHPIDDWFRWPEPIDSLKLELLGYQALQQTVRFASHPALNPETVAQGHRFARIAHMAGRKLWRERQSGVRAWTNAKTL